MCKEPIEKEIKDTEFGLRGQVRLIDESGMQDAGP